MSHFYAAINGRCSVATRTGTKASGMYSYTAGWKGCIYVRLDEHDGQDRYIVSLEPWSGSGGQFRVIAEGPLDANADEFITSGAAMRSPDLEMLATMEIAAADCDTASSKISDGDLSGLADGLADCALMIRTAIAKAKGE